MTEAEWLACDDPVAMLRFLGDRASQRKVRLFACACCRALYSLIPDEHSRKAIKTAERYADGEVSLEKLRFAWGDARRAAQTRRRVHRRALPTGADYALWAVGLVVEEDIGQFLWRGGAAHWALSYFKRSRSGRETNLDEASLLRCVFGSPFRPVACHPDWRSAATLTVAQAAYDERELPSGHLDHGRLAILGDALEDAGSSDADLLAHLRSPCPHIRGCWALDHILGKP